MSVLPGGPLEIVFSFDTTGSMYNCLEEVRGRLQDLIQRLQADIPGIRIAVFAHGDYCDMKHYGYVTKYIDFSTNVAELCNFVKSVGRTGGGDFDECYELVLKEVRQKLSWSDGTNKALVMIGDACPHPPSYRLNTQKIDWRKEILLLGIKRIKIYGVQCGRGSSATGDFYRTISQKTGGKHIQLSDFSNIFDLMMAVCYRERGEDMLQAYETEVRERRPGLEIGKELDGVFGALRECSSPPTPVLEPIDEPKKLCKKPASLPFKPKLTKCGSKVVPIPPLKKIKGLKSTTKKSVRLSRKPAPKKKVSEKISLLQREDVSENAFALCDRVWSPWKLAMASELPLTGKSAWRKRRHGAGFKLRRLFNNASGLSLFEVAVQCKKHEKKSVVCFKLSKCVCKSPSWETRLFGRKDIKYEINRLMKKGCKIYIRRLSLQRKSSALKVMKTLKKYDYAWKFVRGQRVTHRHIAKNGVKISDSNYVNLF